MKIKSIYLKITALFLSLLMLLTPGMVTLAFAQTATPTETASDDEIQTVQQLAKAYEEDYSNATAGVMCKRPYAVTRWSGI